MSIADIIKSQTAAKYRADDEGRRWTEAHPSFWTKSALKKRGWSGGMVRLQLGEPDKIVANPHDPAGGEPASMYLRTRVMAAEASDEFKAARDEARTQRGKATR